MAEDSETTSPRLPLDYESADALVSAGIAKLKSFKSPFEANLARAKLEANGIECRITGENATAMDPLQFNEVTLYVRQSQFDEAQRILERRAEIADGEDGDGATDETDEPIANSDAVLQPIQPPVLRSMLLLTIAGLSVAIAFKLNPMGAGTVAMLTLSLLLFVAAAITSGYWIAKTQRAGRHLLLLLACALASVIGFYAVLIALLGRFSAR